MCEALENGRRVSPFPIGASGDDRRLVLFDHGTKEGQDLVPPLLSNRVSEITDNLRAVKERVGELEAVHKVAGTLNPADLVTRPGVTPKQVGPGSLWQEGPRFLKLPRVDWPIYVPDEQGAVPQEELRRHEVAAVVSSGEDQL